MTTQTKPISILVADDDLSTRLILRLILKREGYEVIEAENGEQCLQHFSTTKPDMVLLDACMPIVDGFICCERIRQLAGGDRTPILIITGLEDQASVDQAFESGATDFVTKPIQPSVLSRRIRYLLEASQAESALRDREQRYRSVVDNLREVIFQTNQSGELIFLNPAWEIVTGFPDKVSIGQNLFSFIYPEEGQLLWNKFQKILAGQLEEWRQEVRFFTQNGGVCWMEVYACSLMLRTNIISGISGSLDNITERKEREALDQLEKSTNRVLAESSTLDKAVPNLLDAIGRAMGWDYGEFWIQEESLEHLTCLQSWTMDSDSELKGCDEKKKSEVNFIQSLWEKGGLSWFPSLSAGQVCFNTIVGHATEMQSALSFPILGGFKKMGMVIFFKRSQFRVDTRLLNCLESIGSQIGAFMITKLAEAELHRQHDLMRAELSQASVYISNLLPQPIVGDVSVEHLFMPSSDLGGDVFDYYWLDENHFAIFLLDVAGHGVQSALLSISVLNVMRSRSLKNANFYEPSTVLKELNNAFPMGPKGDDYFTIWYGVYNRQNHTLTYSSAGHPPALLILPNSTVIKLDAGGIPVGMLSDMNYDQAICNLEANSQIYLFSDGVYEITQKDGSLWEYDSFVDVVLNYQKRKGDDLTYIFDIIREVKGKDALDDDFSLLEVTF